MSSRNSSHSSRSSQRSNRSSPVSSRSFSGSRSRSSSRSRSRSRTRSFGRTPDYRRAAFANLRNQRLPPFDLQTELTIGSKRMVEVVGETVVITLSMVIYHKDMSKEEQKEAIDMIMKKGQSEHRCALNGEENDWVQRTCQGERLMLIESVFKVNKTKLESTWEKKDIRRHDRVGTVKIQRNIGDISLTTTYSLKNDLGGFALSAKMKVGMGSRNDDETKLTRRNSDYRRRMEQPNVEEMIHLGETFAADQQTLVLSSDTRLARDVIQILQEAEEHRQYSFDMRNHRHMTILEPSFRSPRRQLFSDQSANSSIQPSIQGSKGMDSTQYFSCTQSFHTPEDRKNASEQVQQSPSMSLGQYQSMQETKNRSRSPSASRSPKPTAHIIPQFQISMVPLTTPVKTPPRVQNSPTVPTGPSNTSQTLNTAFDNTTTMHQHQLKLFCDIGGTAYEFTGKISYEAADGVSLDPRRVVFDSKVLWQHSNEWNPTSITSSFANMTGSFASKK